MAGDETEDPDFVGWSVVPASGGFDATLAPVYWRRNEPGDVRLAMRVTQRHLNPRGAVHGGCLMALADVAMFAFAHHDLAHRGVTVSLSGDFLGSAGVGDILEATGEILRSGGSLLFLRGVITARERPVLSFSGVIKRIRPVPT